MLLDHAQIAIHEMTMYMSLWLSGKMYTLHTVHERLSGKDCVQSPVWSDNLPESLMRVRSDTLHGSETWPVRKENAVALQWAEIRMVRWMCGIKVKDRVSSRV